LEQCDTLAITSPFGHDIWQPVRSGYCRIAFQNVRGIDRGPDLACEVLEATSLYDISIFGIAEPNMVFDDTITHTINAKNDKHFGCGSYVLNLVKGGIVDTTLAASCNSLEAGQQIGP